jgi:hypothetical protein
MNKMIIQAITPGWMSTKQAMDSNEIIRETKALCSIDQEEKKAE